MAERTILDTDSDHPPGWKSPAAMAGQLEHERSERAIGLEGERVERAIDRWASEGLPYETWGLPPSPTT